MSVRERACMCTIDTAYLLARESVYVCVCDEDTAQCLLVGEREKERVCGSVRERVCVKQILLLCERQGECEFKGERERESEFERERV